MCLLLALQWGGTRYNWDNGRIIALFVVFAVLMLVFIGIQIWKGDYATVPSRIVCQRSMGLATFYAFLLGASFFIMVYYLPIWFQAIKGVSAMKSGIMTIPLVLTLVLFSLISGAGTTFSGHYVPFLYFGSVLSAIGAGLLTTFTTTTGHSKWIGYQFIYGAGIGAGMQMPIIASQAVLKLEDVPVSTAIVIFAQTLGGYLFVSVAQNIFNNHLVQGVMEWAPHMNPSSVAEAGATNLESVIPPESVSSVLVAYNRALAEKWYVSAAMSAVSIIGALGMEWRNIKANKASESSARTAFGSFYTRSLFLSPEHISLLGFSFQSLEPGGLDYVTKSFLFTVF